jgi:hypothetical protein
MQWIPTPCGELFTNGELLVSPESLIALGSRMNRIAKAGDSLLQILRLDRASLASLEMTTHEFVPCAEHPLRDLILAQMVIHLFCLP